MRIPETPEHVAELDIMRRLKAYAEGGATWYDSGAALGRREREACDLLHTNLVALVEHCIHPLLDRITAREMQAFTMHDRSHALKVAHLMWRITNPSRRQILSPGEIALLVAAANLHDLGMGLSEDERRARLSPESDLWENIDPQSPYLKAVEGLAALAAKADTPLGVKSEALYQVEQAQEALLCADTRGRHATKERYTVILDWLAQLHVENLSAIPDVHSVLSFDGDSYERKLIDICVSHNQDAHALLESDPTNLDQLRFPEKYPVGCCTADCRFVAAALRLADILDFDRERTPSVLFHYLLPRSANPFENISVREWSKHLAISNWEINQHKVVFRGRSPSAFTHHTIVEFCHTIEDEIARTKSSFNDEQWPFSIDANVEPAIEAIGYRYVPYKFSLDEERIYTLLMGRSIYSQPLDALRELIQNAVDACKLRDALVLCHEPSIVPAKQGRIVVKYEDADVSGGLPILSVVDSGVGMDRYVIENYFLKVGRSYYSSSDFLQTRSLLKKRHLNFSPVSEFGIGFMSVFMLGDQVEVETAPWFPSRNDTQRRVLRIDGLGRLIEVTEDRNTLSPRFHGTRVSIRLASRDPTKIPSWGEVETYLRSVCRNLDYPLSLQHVAPAGTTETQLLAEGLSVSIPEHLQEAALVIPVDEPTFGLQGEIVLFRAEEGSEAEATLAANSPISTAPEEGLGSGILKHAWGQHGILLRGGFAVGTIPGLPNFILTPKADGRVEVRKDRERPSSLPVTDLSRSRLLESDEIAGQIFKIWFGALVNGLDDLEARPIGSPDIDQRLFRRAKWLEEYSAFELYRLARTGWCSSTGDIGKRRRRITKWETGNGDDLLVGAGYGSQLHWTIFELILPKITQLMVGDGGHYYVIPPHPGWEDEFRAWNSFISDGMSWGPFALYSTELGDVLYDVQARQFLNIAYRDRFAGFSDQDLRAVPALLYDLAGARYYQHQARIASQSIPLVDRVLSVAADLTIDRFGKRYLLADFAGANLA